MLLASSARANEPTAKAVLAELPFLEFHELNRVVIDLAPEKSARRMPMLVDTGATFSFTSPGGAEAMGVRVRRLKRDPYRRRTRLGRDLQFYVDVQSSDTSSKSGYEFALVGGNFLAEYVVEFDFPARRVRFLDPRRYRVPKSASAPDEAVLPLEVVSNRPGFELEVNGESILVLLDTGAPGPALLSGKAAARSGVASAPVPGLSAGGLLGPVDVEFGEARSVRVGPFELGPLPVEVAPKGFYNQGFPGDSIVGYDLLAQFVVRIDYANERLWLRRHPSAKATFMGMEYELMRFIGALLVPADWGFGVWVVLPDSPAAKTGVQPGDRFVTEATQAQVAAAISLGERLKRDANGVWTLTPVSEAR